MLTNDTMNTTWKRYKIYIVTIKGSHEITLATATFLNSTYELGRMSPFLMIGLLSDFQVHST